MRRTEMNKKRIEPPRLSGINKQLSADSNHAYACTNETITAEDNFTWPDDMLFGKGQVRMVEIGFPTSRRVSVHLAELQIYV